MFSIKKQPPKRLRTDGSNVPDECSDNTLLKCQNESRNFKPLAELMRPSQLEQFVGQENILGEASMLRKLIASNNVPSMILWGPPGCGKTTVAHIISQRCKQSCEARFVTLSATSSGVKDVKDILERAKNDRNMFKKKNHNVH